MVAGDLERLGAGRGRGHVEPGVAQGGREQLADVGLVLDDEQAGLGCLGGHALSVARIPVSSLDVGWDLLGCHLRVRGGSGPALRRPRSRRCRSRRRPATPNAMKATTQTTASRAAPARANHPQRASLAAPWGSVDCLESATIPRIREGRQNRQHRTVAIAETMVRARALPFWGGGPYWAGGQGVGVLAVGGRAVGLLAVGRLGRPELAVRGLAVRGLAVRGLAVPGRRRVRRLGDGALARGGGSERLDRCSGRRDRLGGRARADRLGGVGGPARARPGPGIRAASTTARWGPRTRRRCGPGRCCRSWSVVLARAPAEPVGAAAHEASGWRGRR